MHELNPSSQFFNFCLTPSDPPLPRERGKLNNSFSSPSPLGEGFRERRISVVNVNSRDPNEEIIGYHVPKKKSYYSFPIVIIIKNKITKL
jgi:hypothetical protein